MPDEAILYAQKGISGQQPGRSVPGRTPGWGISGWSVGAALLRSQRTFGTDRYAERGGSAPKDERGAQEKPDYDL